MDIEYILANPSTPIEFSNSMDVYKTCKAIADQVIKDRHTPQYAEKWNSAWRVLIGIKNKSAVCIALVGYRHLCSATNLNGVIPMSPDVSEFIRGIRDNTNILSIIQKGPFLALPKTGEPNDIEDVIAKIEEFVETQG